MVRAQEGKAVSRLGGPRWNCPSPALLRLRLREASSPRRIRMCTRTRVYMLVLYRLQSQEKYRTRDTPSYTERGPPPPGEVRRTNENAPVRLGPVIDGGGKSGPSWETKGTVKFKQAFRTEKNLPHPGDVASKSFRETRVAPASSLAGLGVVEGLRLVTSLVSGPKRGGDGRWWSFTGGMDQSSATKTRYGRCPRGDRSVKRREKEALSLCVKEGNWLEMVALGNGLESLSSKSLTGCRLLADIF